MAGFAVKHNQFIGLQPLGNRQPQAAGDMVVAHAGHAHRFIARPDHHGARGRRLSGNLHDAFEHLGDLGAGEPVIAMPAALLHAHQAVLDHLRQMAAGGRGGHIARPGQLGGGQHASVHELQQHGGGRGVTHQGGNSGDLVGVHGLAFSAQA